MTAPRQEHADADPPLDEPHRHRQVAESFGRDAERYDRARPRYPAAMVERIVAASPGRSVLDVGCGTGIAARQFQDAGCRVLGVDVDDRMAAFARHRGLAVEVAAFESWEHGGRVFDAVVSGQTWHWIDPVAGAAKAAEVLRPGGRLALFWNVFQPPSDLAEAMVAVHRRVMPGPFAEMSARPALDMYSVMFAKAADGIDKAGAYGDAEQWRYEWESSVTRAEWLEQLPTQGGYAQLPPERLEELLAGMGAAVDALGGSFTAHYTTVAVVAARTGAD
jgi:SAM-dependent methyltransferase